MDHRGHGHCREGAGPVSRSTASTSTHPDRLHPSQLVCALRVLVFEHDALTLWRGLRAGIQPGPPDAAPTIAAVWRDGANVLHARVDLDEGLALESALAGDPVARLCAAFGRAEDPVGAAFAALASWFDEGWIAAIVPSPGTVGTAA